MADLCFLDDAQFGLANSFEPVELPELSLDFAAPVPAPLVAKDTAEGRKLHQFSKGTTTLGFVFREGILIAVDARATMGSFIGSKKVKKVIEINDFLLGTMAGGAAHCYVWENQLARICRLYEL